jgi:hypothetical protein
MKNKFYLLILLVCLFQVLSCKKDSQKQVQPQGLPLESGLLTFSISGQLFQTNIDTTANNVNIVLPHTLDLHTLAINFTLASQVNATIKNAPVTSGVTVDFSKLVYFTVTSADKKRSTTFFINIQSDLLFYGLIGNVIAENSLNKDYTFYYDQFDGSTYQAVNCGPTVATMAIKWADSAFTKKPVDARNTYEPTGGWWSTRNVTDYLNSYGINNETDTLSNLDSLVKVNIDKNQVIILCLDMYYVSYDDLLSQHLNKFYETGAPGWGHFILVKGYKQMTSTFYLEVYDPYSQGQEYFPSVIPNEPRGQDRYYTSSDIKTATNVWNPYAMIIAPKGQQAIASTKLNLNNRKSIPAAFGR